MSVTLPIHITNFERPQTHDLIVCPQTLSIGKEPLGIGPYSNIFPISNISATGILIPTRLEMLIRPLWNPAFYETLIRYAGIEVAQMVFIHPLGVALVHSQQNITPLNLQVISHI